MPFSGLLFPPPPAVELKSNSLQVGLNGVLQLTCRAIPPQSLTVSRFSWQFNGDTIRVDSSDRHQVARLPSNREMLMIVNMVFSDTGNYGCMAVYSNGSTESSMIQEIMVVSEYKHTHASTMCMCLYVYVCIPKWANLRMAEDCL